MVSPELYLSRIIAAILDTQKRHQLDRRGQECRIGPGVNNGTIRGVLMERGSSWAEGGSTERAVTFLVAVHRCCVFPTKDVA